MASHRLFEFVETLAVALGRKKITGQQASVALFMAVWSKGTSGEGATIDAKRLSVELGISERQVWRHVKALRLAGWFEQTDPPKRGYAGERGARARYRLTCPALDLSLDHGLTDLGEETSLDVVANAESTDTSGSNRLTLSTIPSDTAAPGNGTVPPTDVPPTDVPPRVAKSSDSTSDRAQAMHVRVVVDRSPSSSQRAAGQ